MTLHIDTLLSTSPNDDIIINKKIKTFVDKRDIYYFGGVNSGTESPVVIKFSRDSNRITRMPDLPNGDADVCLYTINEHIYVISHNQKYILDDGTWCSLGYTAISNAQAVRCGDTTFIINKNNIFSVNESNYFEKLQDVSVSKHGSLVKSSSHNKIFFTQSYYNIVTGEMVDMHGDDIYTDDYIVHNDEYIDVSEEDMVTVLCDDGYLFYMDINSKQLYYRLVYGDAIHPHSTAYNNAISGAHAIVAGDKNTVHFTTVNNTYHSIHKLNTETLETCTCLSLKRTNNSFSRRPLYNHHVPHGAIINDLSVLVGGDGFYKDTSETDNSLYFKDNTVPFTGDIKVSKVLQFNNEHLGLYTNNDKASITTIDVDGNIIENVLFIGNYSEYDATVTDTGIYLHKLPDSIYCCERNYGYNYHIPDSEVLGITVSEYHAYFVANSKKGTFLYKVSHGTREGSCYEINNIDELCDVKYFENRVYILYESSSYISLDRIFINE